MSTVQVNKRPFIVGFLALITLSIWWSGIIPGTDRGEILRGNLTYGTLAQFLSDVEQPIEAVAIYDEGPFAEAPQWYLLLDIKGAEDVRVGLFGDDLLRHENSEDSCAAGWNTKGKQLVVLSGGQVIKSRHACERDQMDIAALINIAPRATFVMETMHNHDGITQRAAEIAASELTVGVAQIEIAALPEEDQENLSRPFGPLLNSAFRELSEPDQEITHRLHYLELER